MLEYLERPDRLYGSHISISNKEIMDLLDDDSIHHAYPEALSPNSQAEEVQILLRLTRASIDPRPIN